MSGTPFPKPIPQRELNARLEKLDASFETQGVPLRFRPLESFKALYGPVPDSVRSALFDPIALWYIDAYGVATFERPILARIPIMLRRAVYLLIVPLDVAGLAKITDYVEDLPANIAQGLSKEEFEPVGRSVASITESFHKLYELNLDDYILAEADRAMMKRGLFDLDHAATSLANSGDTQNSIFHSHAAAEKFLKIALRRLQPMLDVKKFGHKVLKVFELLAKADGRLMWLQPSVDALHKAAPDMEVRYSTVPRTTEQALTAFNAAAYIAGSLAGVWLLEVRRKGKDAGFIPGRFYKDLHGRKYYCTGMNAQTAELILFGLGSSATLGVMAELRLKTSASVMYLEITDEQQLREARVEFNKHLLNRGRLMKPEELGIKIANGPEGSYVTALITAKVK